MYSPTLQPQPSNFLVWFWFSAVWVQYCFLYLSCLVFSEHLGYVVSGLSLTLESSWMYLSCPILSSPAGIPITYMGLRSSIVLFTLFFFFVFFSLGHFYLPVFTFTVSFLSCVSSLLMSLLHLCYHILKF